MTHSAHALRRPGLLLALLAIVSAVLLIALAAVPGAVDASSSESATEPAVDPATVPTVDPDAPELAFATVRGTGEQVAYDVIDNMAVVEHDILLGTHAEVQANGIEPLEVTRPAECDPGLQCGVINASSSRMWANGVVPFRLAAGTTTAAADNIQAAIDHWEQKTSIDFVARTNETDYVEFVSTGAGNTCSSYLGRIGGRQQISYAGTGRGCMIHEIGHAVGLSHEQNRNDRDEYIIIDFTNISGNAASQFRIASGSTDVGAYDFNSIMHYSAFSFALDSSKPVIIPRDGRDPRSIGGRGALTSSDVQAVEFVYGGSNPPPPPPTTTTTTTTTTAPTTTTTTAPTTTTTTAPTTTITTAPPTSPPSTGPPRTIPPPTIPPPTIPPPTIPPTIAPPTIPPTIAPPPTTPTTRPKGNQPPVLEFTNVADGDTIKRRIRYGGINVRANDPDVGTEDGDGIRWVTLVLSDAETGRFLGARREYRSTYDWGLRLRRGRTYTLTAYAVSDRSGGRGWSSTSITVSTK